MNRERPNDYQHLQIQDELSKFINLLQSDFKSNSHQQHQAQQYTLSKKLSVILSASQPQSSSLDKENSNPSANRSFSTNQKISQSNQGIINQLLNSGLNLSQKKLVQKLKAQTEGLRQQKQKLQNQCQQLKRDLAMERAANDQILNVLMRLDKQEKELWGNYNALTATHQQAVEKCKLNDHQLQRLKESLIAIQNDNQFMKKLIFHANQNYQILENKCSQMQILKERNQANTDRKNVKKQSADKLLKSAKTKKNGLSPNHSEMQNYSNCDDFQQIYRRMIVRTLKFKGKQQVR